MRKFHQVLILVSVAFILSCAMGITHIYKLDKYTEEDNEKILRFILKDGKTSNIKELLPILYTYDDRKSTFDGQFWFYTKEDTDKS